jgi:hypothetical protein
MFTEPSCHRVNPVSHNTIYNYVPELQGGRLALSEATSTAELPWPAKPKD